MDRLKLTYPQYLVLLALWEKDARRISDLAEQLHLPAHALTPILKRMEGAGLVTRRPNSTDKRVTDVVLQPAGKALKRKAYGVADEVACATGLNDSEVATLRSQRHDLSNQLTAALDRNSHRQEPIRTTSEALAAASGALASMPSRSDQERKLHRQFCGARHRPGLRGCPQLS